MASDPPGGKPPSIAPATGEQIKVVDFDQLRQELKAIDDWITMHTAEIVVLRAAVTHLLAGTSTTVEQVLQTAGTLIHPSADAVFRGRVKISAQSLFNGVDQLKGTKPGPH